MYANTESIVSIGIVELDLGNWQSLFPASEKDSCVEIGRRVWVLVYHVGEEIGTLDYTS